MPSMDVVVLTTAANLKFGVLTSKLLKNPSPVVRVNVTKMKEILRQP
jgi:hypothetical protein